MARNVTYSVSPRINPRDKEAAPKYYGHVQASGDIDIREMSERIQQTCTVHKSDVFAVLVALEDVITDALKGGESSASATSVRCKSASPARVQRLKRTTPKASSRRRVSISAQAVRWWVFSRTSPSAR